MSAFLRQEIALEVRKKARKYVDKAFATVEAIMDNTGVAPDVRLRAAQMLIERAAGKPTQEVFTEGGTSDEYEAQYAEAAAAADELLALPPPEEKPLPPVGLDPEPDNITELRPRQRTVK